MSECEESGPQLVGTVMPKEKMLEIANLEVDCKIGKDRHFIAADRKNRLRIALGLFSVAGSAIMASEAGPSFAKLINTYFSDWSYTSLLLAFLGSWLPLLVGISTAVIGFLGLEKQTAQHRYVGNAYIEISRKARSLINNLSSNRHLSADYLKQYDVLLAQYLEINKEGEACPTNDKDSQRAMSMNQKRRGAVKAKLHEYDLALFEFQERHETPQVGLWCLLIRGTTYKIACVLFILGLIRKSDYRKFIRIL